MTKTVIIVAGGKGKRMNSQIPKQFINLNSLPVLMHTIKKFYDFENTINIILVLPLSEINFWEDLCVKFNFSIKHSIVQGGDERFFSVKNALIKSPDNGFTAIHDGVRPLVNKNVIEKGFIIAQKFKTAVPIIEEFNSIRILKDNEYEHFDRNNIKIVQTPQIFETKILKDAYSVEFDKKFTDDASVVEANGNKIHLFEGNIENIKITTKFDLDFANYLLSINTEL